ncbi:hypothetical protein EXIGLDRAFT_724445 [Exidia glandulosa HHB12029]|uniref:Uncharacterized protein n=1 Tax=Exidia glandulosa HHB12029 TaxID=1314781 RepID=A0A165EEQ9_EXIGL|nr:hypothetical protein EXIGLDRAFT_724445 [Exidia glandulosa HHB12029]
MSLATSTPDSSTTIRTTGGWNPKLDAWNLVTGWAFPFDLIPTILAKHDCSIPSDASDPLFTNTGTVIGLLNEKGQGIYHAMDPDPMDDNIEIGCNVYTLDDPDEGGVSYHTFPELLRPT